MARSAKSSAKRTKGSKRSAAKPRAKKTAKARDAGQAAVQSSRFVRDLVVRGEAVKVGRGGKLPPGATHVVETTKDGTVEVVRRVRVSLY